jgi:2,3-bisphosphoglycerate-independent phosphoglycerate mutase
MSGLLIILDGMQDIPYPELGGKTPYDSGKGESFTRLEAASAKGKLVATPLGFEPDTQTCVLTMLGVQPEDIPSGRSYTEALAVGMDVGDDDIIMRCNFVKVEDGKLAVPCCPAPTEVGEALLEAVRGEGYPVRQVGAYKSLQVVPGGAKYIADIKMDMPHQHQGEDFESLLPRGNMLADSLADFSREMLRLHAPYTVFNWSPAVKAALPAFGELWPGKTGAVVSKTDTPVGAAVAMRMESPALPTCTGDTDTDLAAKVKASLELLSRNDVVIAHIGGPDEASHRQDPVEKAEFIAKLDREFIAPILDGAPDGTRIMVTSDHVGLCSTAGHTDEPVDFWLYEKSGSLSGDLGIVDGKRTVGLLLGL